MRVGPVALRSWASRADLLRAATLTTRVTHASEEALAAALMHVVLVDAVLRDGATVCNPVAALDVLRSALPSTGASVAMLEKLRHLTVDDPAADIASSCGTSPLAAESVPAALASFLRVHESYESAITEAAALGGDVDSICAMVGCLAGALHGIDAIPKSWIAAIAHEAPSHDELCRLADAIAALPPLSFGGQAG